LRVCICFYEGGRFTSLIVPISLLVVSTKVGGVPEVLPDEIIIFARPAASDLIRAVLEAVDRSTAEDAADPWAQHERVRKMYSWANVAKRTDAVYRMVMQQGDLPLVERFRRWDLELLAFGWVSSDQSVVVAGIMDAGSGLEKSLSW